MPNEDYKPAWLDADNDGSHKAEIAPLFGTGSLSLLDTEEDQNQGSNGQLIGSPMIKYGAVNADDDFKDEEDVDPSVASSVSSSKQSRKVTKLIITESGKPEFPRRHFALAVFHFLEGFGILSSLCLMATQIVPIVIIPPGEIGAMSLILKTYVSLFCLLFILVEWDVAIGFLKKATFLQTYMSRGFLYSFLGLSCLEEAYSERVKDMVAHARDQFHVSWFSLFMQVSSWAMLGLGVVYMVLGVCCLKTWRDQMVQDYRERWVAYREAMKTYKAQNL